MMNNQGRPTALGNARTNELPTISGDRGLDHEEALIFELGRHGVTGVDLPQTPVSDARLGGQRRKGSHRLARPVGTRGRAPLRAPIAHELRHRQRPLSARFLHDETQSAS